MTSKLILGTVQLGLPYGISNSTGQPSVEESFLILKRAHEAGILLLDTAEAYGSAHHVIGDFHAHFPDNKFQIITKLPHQFETSITTKIKDYLVDLNVTSLFGLLFHSFNSYLENEQNIHELRQLKILNSIQNIGVSVYTNEEFETVINDDRIDIIQLPFNVFDNTNLRGDLIQLAKQKGKIIHTRSCYLQGLFFQDLNSEKAIVHALQSELKYLNKICLSNGKSIQEIALSYCLQEKNIDNVLIGVDSLIQLYQNISLTSKKLSSQILDQINQIKINNTDLLNPSTWNNLKI